MNRSTTIIITRSLGFTFVFLLLSIFGIPNRTTAIAPLPSQVSCNEGQTNPLGSAIENLDQIDKDWGVYCEGSPKQIKENVTSPAKDDSAMRCSITGGTPYSNVHCYRNFSAEPSATSFTLSLDFWFSSTTCNNQDSPSVVQALEFSMSKWDSGKRYELALQWQNVGEGAPRWRYWDPSQIEAERWVPVQVDILDTCLSGSEWHNLTLIGEVVNQQVHYQSFTVDGQTYVLELIVPATPAEGETDRLAIAVQLDGNSTQSPYDVFIDSVNFTRTPSSDSNPTIIAPANLRTCASQTCNVIASLPEGTLIEIERTIEDGEAINGNSTWYEVSYFGAQAFVHSSVVSIIGELTAPLTPVPTPTVANGTPVPLCEPTGDTFKDVLFDVPAGYIAYIASDGIGVDDKHMIYGGHRTTITGPYQGTLRVHVGVYCKPVIIGSQDETFTRDTTQKACASCTAIDLPKDIAKIGESVATLAPTSGSQASGPLCKETGQTFVDVPFDVPAGSIAYIASDGIGVDAAHMIYGGHGTTITGPFQKTLRVQTGVYCRPVPIGSQDEAFERETTQKACITCTAIDLPKDIAKIGG